ncbi:cytochrome P450 [Streptomyces sp. BI20]|uniref:cytochrome P450 n=1 Tax=Streptomyces sp. BI20 TaxID=3403460 RepID=UPI003C7266F9
MDFDPWDPTFIADPYPALRALRAQGRVIRYEPSGQWLVPRHADVSALLRDRRLGRTYLHRYTHEEFGRTPPPPEQEPFHTLNDFGLLDLEDPAHGRVRRLVARAFTPRTVERLVPTVERMARRSAAGFVAAGGGDLLTEIAEPLPVAVIAELLGIPEADRAALRPWSAAICGMYDLRPSPEAARRAVIASEEFSAYLRALITERRRAPGEDLISALIAVHDEGDRLSEQEMISTCVLLLNAGHEATVNTTANGWWALLRHPEKLAELRSEAAAAASDGDGSRARIAYREKLSTAVDELLRFDTPLQLFERWVLEDIEIDGVRIPRGSELALLFGSANRDEERFRDPDALDLGRRENPHVGFGAGIHYCLGAPLARAELVASFGALLDPSTPELRLVEEPRWGSSFVIRGLTGLNVTC